MSSGHWDDVYAAGDAGVSWAQAHAGPVLAGGLLAAGHTDVTVLDLSEQALRLARDRLGDRGAEVDWVVADLLAWRPPRRYALWHDRAVLHFFTEPAQRTAYARVLRQAVAPRGFA